MISQRYWFISPVLSNHGAAGCRICRELRSITVLHKLLPGRMFRWWAFGGIRISIRRPVMHGVWENMEKWCRCMASIYLINLSDMSE